MAVRDTTIVEEMQEMVRRNVEASLNGHGVVRDHIGAVGERNVHLARSFYDDAISTMERQYEGNRALAGELVQQSVRRREALQDITSQGVYAWMGFFGKSFDDYGRGLELAEETEENVQDAVVRGVSSSVFPVEGYDEMNIEQVKKQLDGLNAAQIRTMSEYEKQHKNRETLINLFDRKLRAKSA